MRASTPATPPSSPLSRFIQRLREQRDRRRMTHGAPRASSRPRLRIRWGLVLLVLAVVASLVWLLTLSPLVGVREVAVAGVSDGERETIVRIGDHAVGQPLVKVDTELIANDVISLGTIARVDVERHWPTTLVIRVKPREAVFAMGDGQGGVEVFDAEGIPFWSLDRAPVGVPTATLQTADDQVQRLAAATVVRSLSAAQRARVKELRVAAPDRITLNVGGVVVTWGDPGRSDVKAEIVELLSRRQGVTRINVVVPESPVTGGRETSAPKP